MSLGIPIIATFLPQFHEDELNNKWWGNGFTEWDNVKRAEPLYSDHVQPKIPSTGYYSIIEDGELERQFLEANAHGIDSFMMYHYWSDGRRVLSKPLDLLLGNGQMKFDFNLCWANHPWTRTWRNRKGAMDVLLPQSYERQSEHFEFLARVFSDERYRRVNNRPLFSIYRPSDVPNFKGWCDDLRNHILREVGIEIFLVGMVKNSFDLEACSDLDAVNLFQPSLGLFESEDITKHDKRPLSARVRTSSETIKKILYAVQDLIPDSPRKTSYSEFTKHCAEQYRVSSNKIAMPVVPMLCSGFDNTARYGKRATILTDLNINAFRDHLAETFAICGEQRKRNPKLAAPYLTVNSWNEWGEGMMLQADEEFGNLKLKTLVEVVSNFAKN